ncbi:MAG: hypothetical protein NT158_11820 [Cyanobacteria bacterium]|nr:hypothetical protein [Cyanobacteriota bacterium]
MALQAPQPLEPQHVTFVVGDGAGMVALDGTPHPMAIADRNCLHGSHICFCWAFDLSAAWRPCFSTTRQFQQGF